MASRTSAGLALTAWLIGLSACLAADDKPVVQYVPLDAPAGMSQAVIVRGAPLVHTRQVLPLDRDGKIVAAGQLDKQIDQTLDNLDAVLAASGSGLKRLVRLNVYALAPATVDRVRELLAKRLDPAVRPAITSVLTPLTHRKAMLSVDAVATADEKGQSVSMVRCDKVAGDKDFADAAILPRGGVVYMSGRPEESGLAETAASRSIAAQLKILSQLKISPEQVVQVKVFLKPAAGAGEVEREVKKFFPGQAVPPMVFVEWLAPVPVEIEVIAQLPSADKLKEPVEYYNPPDVVPASTFSRVALVRGDNQIFTSTLFGQEGEGEPQARGVFDRLGKILAETGSDLTHMAKGMYYVSDDDAGRWFDRVRPKYLDPSRPPAASKVTIHAVGKSGRTMSLEMIAVGVGK